jgi:hypothetical protein
MLKTPLSYWPLPLGIPAENIHEWKTYNISNIEHRKWALMLNIYGKNNVRYITWINDQISFKGKILISPEGVQNFIDMKKRLSSNGRNQS